MKTWLEDLQRFTGFLPELIEKIITTLIEDHHNPHHYPGALDHPVSLPDPLPPGKRAGIMGRNTETVCCMFRY